MYTYIYLCCLLYVHTYVYYIRKILKEDLGKREREREREMRRWSYGGKNKRKSKKHKRTIRTKHNLN